MRRVVARLTAACWVTLGAAPAVMAVPAWPAPGDVVSAGPGAFSADPLLRLPMPGVRATHVVYRSTDVHGDPNVVSGTILVPTAPYAGKRPIVGYAVGTHGLGDGCAPSRQMADGVETESAQVMLAIARGWAVALTDYEGLGTPGRHTYVVGPSLGHAVLDAVRAASRAGVGLAADAPVLIWGYSEGGAAATWAAQLQSSYAPELRLLGTAAGGVPADVEVVARHLDGGAFFGFGVSALMGLDAAFPQLDLEQDLNAAGRNLFTTHQDDCLVQLLLPPFTLSRYANITTRDVLARPDVQAAFAVSKLGASAPQAPLLLYHGRLDEVIPTRSASSCATATARLARTSSGRATRSPSTSSDRSSPLPARWRGCRSASAACPCRTTAPRCAAPRARRRPEGPLVVHGSAPPRPGEPAADNVLALMLAAPALRVEGESPRRSSRQELGRLTGTGPHGDGGGDRCCAERHGNRRGAAGADARCAAMRARPSPCPSPGSAARSSGAAGVGGRAGVQRGPRAHGLLDHHACHPGARRACRRAAARDARRARAHAARRACPAPSRSTPRTARRPRRSAAGARARTARSRCARGATPAPGDDRQARVLAQSSQLGSETRLRSVVGLRQGCRRSELAPGTDSGPRGCLGVRSITSRARPATRNSSSTGRRCAGIPGCVEQAAAPL